MEYPSQETIRELLNYNPETGVFTWKPRDRSWFVSDRSFKIFRTRDAGRQAGNFRTNRKGHRSVRIRLLGQTYFAHRIAWIYMTGKPLPVEIDHANGDGWDNRWSNIRSGDDWVNHSNKSMLSNSSSGFMGVSFHKQTGKWRAYIKKSGRQIYLGLYTSKEQANNVAQKARIKAGFDLRHGQFRPYDF